MTRPQIDLLLKQSNLRAAELVETHISWLLMLPETVYKMKKDVAFSFLDFSTKERRKFYCEHELMLNQRLAPDMYQEVVAVNPFGHGLELGPYQDNSIDYAIKMRRVAQKWEMSGMLSRGEVLPEHIKRLASHLAAFHQNAKPDRSTHKPVKELEEFSDVGNYLDILVPYISTTKINEIMDGVEAARFFLRDHRQRFHERKMLGFTVDGHGDLHAANVFLENNQPLVFDCIEFNDEFRKLDVLDEIAFLYVDLEAGGRLDLAEHFAVSYEASNPTRQEPEDELLFDYYKCYRANVRLKVTAIKMNSLPPGASPDQYVSQLHRYLEVYLRHAKELKA